jgi:chromosomal replication initiator protein
MGLATDSALNEPANDGRVVAAVRPRSVSDAGPSPHPWDGYAISPENELAMAAAQAIARGEHSGFSPLVVHGGSGVGKSRLLAGLVAERVRREPGAAVAHLDAEGFAASCNEAAGEGGGWPSLRDRLRTVELFVLEDLEGLERAPSARDELAHTLDALEVSGAGIVVSARSAPGTWSRREWPVRLVNRLLGGLTVRIDPPGLASRRRHLLQAAAKHGITLQAEAVERLAEAADGYRTLDGWITRLVLEARHGQAHSGRGGGAGRRPGGNLHILDVESVAAILEEDALLAGSTDNVGAIARAVAARFGVRLGVLRGPSRRASVVEARHLAMHLARTRTGSSFAAIGAYFGGRDPATVRHACRAAVVRIEADPALASAVVAIGHPWKKGDAG